MNIKTSNNWHMSLYKPSKQRTKILMRLFAFRAHYILNSLDFFFWIIAIGSRLVKEVFLYRIIWVTVVNDKLSNFHTLDNESFIEIDLPIGYSIYVRIKHSLMNIDEILCAQLLFVSPHKWQFGNSLHIIC